MAETKLQGGCLCGAVRYEVSGDPAFVGHCHCEHCRKATASGHSTIAAYPEAMREHIRATSTSATSSGERTALAPDQATAPGAAPVPSLP